VPTITDRDRGSQRTRRDAPSARPTWLIAANAGEQSPADDQASTDIQLGSPAGLPADAAQPAETPAAETPAQPSFADMGLPVPLVRALERAGIASPFPIQAATLPDAIAGRDVLGRAQTGSGKTLAFGLAMIARLSAEGGNARPNHPRGLVLVPTRELAMQIADALMPFAKSLGLWCRIAVGGTSFTRQVDALRRGIDLLIATPGRLSDHVRQGTCVLSEVSCVALDEADQMADMGFLPQVREILDLTDPNGQRLLFSATLDGDVDTLVRKYLHNAVEHSVAPASASVTTMEHHLLLISAADKTNVVTEVAAREGRTIMFVRTKHAVDKLTDKLRSVGVRAGALHGGKTQGARTRILTDFREGHTPVLVATDVAARGIHVEDVSLVVHVDPPADSKDYLHRAGRTARAGQSGTVVTLATHQQKRAVLGMTARAGVRPSSTRVRPGDEALSRITGARLPSGEPVVDEPRRHSPRPNRPDRAGHRDGRGFAPRGGRSREFRDRDRRPRQEH
jgi:superfamily II DNA/RNA helicase